MGEGTQHRSQSTMPDHRRHLGHEAIVVGEGYDLDVLGDTYGVAVDRWAEREDSLEIEIGDCLADAVDQLRLAADNGRAERQQHPLALDFGAIRSPRMRSDPERPGIDHVCRRIAVDIEPARRGDEHELGRFPGGETIAGGGEPEQPMSRCEAPKIRRPAASGSEHLRPRESIEEVNERHARRARGPSRRDCGRQHAVDDGEVGA
jgi:hypothetical protein